MPFVHQSTTSAVGAKTLNRSKKVHTEKKRKIKKIVCLIIAGKQYTKFTDDPLNMFGHVLMYSIYIKSVDSNIC